MPGTAMGRKASSCTMPRTAPKPLVFSLSQAPTNITNVPKIAAPAAIRSELK